MERTRGKVKEEPGPAGEEGTSAGTFLALRNSTVFFFNLFPSLALSLYSTYLKHSADGTPNQGS